MAMLNFATLLLFAAIVMVHSEPFGYEFEPYEFPQMSFPAFPAMPQMPAIRPFRKMKPFPPITFPAIVIPSIQVPDADDIRNAKPGPGQSFSGIIVSSTNGWTKKDGKWVQTGGSSIVTNDNGHVEEFTTGDLKPNSEKENVDERPLDDFDDNTNFFGEFDQSDNLFKSPEPKQKKYKKKYNADFDDVNAGPSSHFSEFSQTSYQEYSDVNGAKTSSGKSSSTLNVDGKITKKDVVYDGDKDPVVTVAEE